MRRMERKILAAALFVNLALASVPVRAICPVDVVIVKGRVENPPSASRVTIQLVYSKEPNGESGETSIERGTFVMQIPFLTQARVQLEKSVDASQSA